MAEVCGVVFDLDDTLHAERRFVLSGLRHVARLVEARHGVPAATAYRVAVRAFRRGPRRLVLQSLCRVSGLPEMEIGGWVEAMRGHSPALRLPAATTSMLVALRGAGLRLAILTNGLPDVQRRKVTALELDGLVDTVVYADAIAPGGKPGRRCFEATAQRLGLPPSRMVMVGNARVEDIAGARAAGWRTVLLDRRGADPGEADACVRRVADVPAALRMLTRRYARAS